MQWLKNTQKFHQHQMYDESSHETTQNPDRLIMLIQSFCILMHESAQDASYEEGIWVSPYHQVPSQAHQHYYQKSTIFSIRSSCKPYIIQTMTSWCIGEGKDSYSLKSYLNGTALYLKWNNHTSIQKHKSASVLTMMRPY